MIGTRRVSPRKKQPQTSYGISGNALNLELLRYTYINKMGACEWCSIGWNLATTVKMTTTWSAWEMVFNRLKSCNYG